MSTPIGNAAPPAAAQTSPSIQDMTLRDLFAGLALVGLIPAPKVPGVAALDRRGMARAAYAYADELLAQRSGEAT